MSKKLPNERIAEIMQEAISRDWVSHGGNRFSSEQWQSMCENEPGRMIQAVIAYLDERAEESPGGNGD